MNALGLSPLSALTSSGNRPVRSRPFRLTSRTVPPPWSPPSASRPPFPRRSTRRGGKAWRSASGASGPRWGATTGPWLRGLPAVSPCAPGAAGAALQRPLGDPPPAGGAGPGLPAARSRDADQEIEPHPQARDERAEHHGPLSARSATRLSSMARRTAALLPHNEVRTTPANTSRTAARARQRPTQTA